MPAGLIRFAAFSLATQGLLASGGKASRPLYRSTTFNVPSTALRCSSIADAMLGRAVKDHGPPAPKSALEKQLFSSSPAAPNGNIQEQFDKVRQSSKSIGGFTGYTNSANPSNALHARSTNINHDLKRKTISSTTFASTASTSGLHSVFSKQSSFSNTSDTIDLTDEDPVKQHPMLSQQHVIFDENDFDDDADLDLDMDYDLPMSMAAPPKPAPNPLAQSTTSFAVPQRRHLPVQRETSRHPTSSAQTWSSSPPSHKMTPPGALERRQWEEQAARELSQATSIADSNPRSAKRRTLPWAQERAEKDEITAIMEAREEELAALAASTSSPSMHCFQCKKNDHYVKNCPNRGTGKGTVYGYTPLPKDKHMPWNTTGSAVANQKKQFKDKQKRKISDAEIEAMESHQRKKQVAMAPITLSDEQQRVLDLVVGQQKSVFFTGSAGTGKSVLMRAIIAELRKRHVREPDRVAVTASTGLAACNIGGVTLHSFGGIGLGKEDIPTLVKKIKRNAKAKTRWLRTKILIIDEISMVDGDLFDKLEGIARMMRNNGRPFGGIQLVITGDFFQLPPVPDYDNKSRGAKFAFDAGTWSTAIHHTIGLTEVFRQKDPVFANMLNEMRLGKITDETVKAFRQLSRKIAYEDSLDATELFPTRNEVENSNSYRMRSLAGRAYTYEAADTGAITDLGMRDKLLANMMAPKTLSLKKGAQVMLIKNMDDGLVNGSLGKVVAFMSEKTFEIYDANPDILDESIPLEALDEEEQLQRSSIKATYSSKRESTATTGKEYPLVRFSVADGTTRDLLVQPEEWKVELPSGEVQAQRSQLPLILAWALSIHKAQGQTLERVKIDLKKIFEKGQAYVALSRATSQAGLEVQNFEKSKVMAHPRVAQFYDSLYSVNKALQHPKVAKPPPKRKEESYEEEFMTAAKGGQGRGFNFDSEEEAMVAYG